jgi:hypothetical protein
MTKMPKKINPELRARALRMVQEHQQEAADDDLARVQQAARPIFAALGDARLSLVTRLSSEGPMSIVRLSHGSA